MSPRPLLHEAFSRAARRWPKRTALLDEGAAISFAELEVRSNQLAHWLRRAGVGHEAVVGVMMDRSAAAIASILAVMKAGAAYLPLDPGHPVERLTFTIGDSGAAVALTRDPWSNASVGSGTCWLDTGALANRLAAMPPTPPALEAPPALAHVSYTSGSSGVPKGILGLHAGMMNRFEWMWRRYPFEPAEVCVHRVPLSFVDSLWEMLGPLSRGVPVAVFREPVHRLVDFLALHRVTRMVVVPSLLERLLDYPNLGARVPDLRLCSSSGEALRADVARRFCAAVPGARLINLYGQTETSADTSCFDTASLPPEAERVPIGRPIAGTDLYLLDERDAPVPAGGVGEIVVAGAGVARGYVNRPELTARRFTADPLHPGAGRVFRTGDRGRVLPSGDFEFLGRVDRQVKVRGVRVELDEIELALRACRGVRQAAVAMVGSSIAAWIVSDGGEPPSANALRRQLAARLPEAMLPSTIELVAELPSTVSGKLDRARLAGTLGERRHD